MTTSDGDSYAAPGPHSERLLENLGKVEALTTRLVDVLASKSTHNAALNGPNHDLFAKATAAYVSEAINNPARILQNQLQYWSQSVAFYASAQSAMARGKLEAADDPGPKDRRFSNPIWDENPYFNFIKQQYLINAKAVEDTVEELLDLDGVEKQRLTYFTKQIVDMFSPTNFLPTNPDALQKAVETEGQSLVDGLENLVADLEANNGELVVRLADESAFELGRNIGSTPGKVILRNDMMELIQFSPTTEKVHETPVVLFPPWINKYYILDLKESNSLVKFITDQGYTLFVVSWINPGPEHADVGMEDYIQDGYLTAIDAAKKICKVKQINAVGYCIAGTTLSLTLSLLKKRKDKSIKSATFFTALTDFSDQGEFTPFLSNDFIDGIEAEVAKHGVLRSYIMARTFSYLRSNDLIYGPAIRSYMMGETPPAFDLLYWNGDGANLPAKMVVQYLRGLCQENRFAKDGFELMGETLKLSDVDLPLMSITCETDHIAAWRDCYRGVQQMASKDKTFVVSESGHIAGIVNPPSKKKYGHYLNDDLSLDAAEWLSSAERHDGSWWPLWEEWLRPRSGKMVKARVPGTDDFPALEDAPGRYVRMKAAKRA